MTVQDSLSRQQILDEFHRRRTRALGILIVVFQTRAINAGALRHEQELRERMGLPSLPPDAGPRRGSGWVSSGSD